MKHLVALSFISILAHSIFAVGCATKSQQSQQQSAKKSKNPPMKVVLKQKPGGLVSIPIKPLNSDSDFSAYISRLSIPTNEYTEKDRITWNSYLVAPIAGSLHEAAVVVGAVRDSLSPSAKAMATNKEIMAQTQNPVPAHSNVIAVNDSPTQHPINLEYRVREKGVDLAAALTKNPFLKSQHIFGMVWDAVLKDNNSQMFMDNIHAAIKAEYQLWDSLASRLGLNEAAAPPQSLASPEPSKPADEFKSEDIRTSATTPPEPNLPLSAAENAEASKIFSNAQALAGKEDFEKAVVEARKIRKGAEVQSSAQENIVNWSNKAVQNLRRQAANQYRSSSSTNDPAGKKAYLSKAKSNLQDAMSKFPESTNLDTVKENLDIIEKELSKLP